MPFLAFLAAATAAATLVPEAVAAPTIPAEGTQGFVRVPASELEWVEWPGSHGAKSAVVLGDPSKPGVYIIRQKFPPYWMDTPHWHSADRYITVLEGVWYTGTGSFDMNKAVALPAGSVMVHPHDGIHWDGSGDSHGTTVEVIGMGPVTNTFVDPKAPIWINVARP
jgi:hypothetical protein